MKKRYDYHSLLDILKITFVMLVLNLLLIFLLLLFLRRGGNSISEWISITIIILIIIIAYTIAYLETKHSFFEVNEKGILYHGWRKELFAFWSEILEIKAATRSYKVYTTKGAFTIRQVEAAEQTAQKSFLFSIDDRRKYTEELIQIIKNNASNVKFTYSIFNRPLKF